MLFKRKKSKYKAIFLVQEHGTYEVIKKKRFNPFKRVIKYKKKPYSPILHLPTYRKGSVKYYAFEKDGKQITIKDDNNKPIKDKKGKPIKAIKQINTELQDNDKDAEIKDLLYAREIITQILTSIEKPKILINWVHLLAIGVCSILAGWIIGSYFPIGVVD